MKFAARVAANAPISLRQSDGTERGLWFEIEAGKRVVVAEDRPEAVNDPSA